MIIPSRFIVGREEAGEDQERILNRLASLRGGISVFKMSGCTRNRGLWTNMITNVILHGL